MHRACRTAALGLAAVALALLGGCSTIFPRVEVADTTPPLPAAMPEAALRPDNGAIFQSVSYRPLFEDYRARLVGDTLTVQIVEKVSATASSTSSIDKSGALTGGITAMPGISPKAFARASVGATSGDTYAGKGATANSNDFSGTITVVVRQVLPNGHLLIAGEKQIGVNENVDVLRFSGQVDPRAIQPGNVVQSAQIANVRLEQRGRGQQAEAQAMGWLGRIFLNVLPL
ncbi:MAG: flagellar basal body L-ring protein FlgH [Burkholderiales bacterium]|nr:flagellar basal body L-ring protein FlgH [Burkholderiales bacterium]MDE2275162.1 flagellar basal body L-ring protein FlgH [Burkholderiales bacterium]